MKKVGEGKFIFNVERQRGFTLMEVMIVIAIIGILSAIAIPNFLSYRDHSRLRAAASDMLSTFRKAQVAAVKRKCNSGLIFNAAAGTATLFLDNGAGAGLGGVANDNVRNGTEPVLETYTVPVGCNMPNDKITFGDKKTGYTPRGLPSTLGGRVEVHSTSASSDVAYQIILSMAGHARIAVIPN